MLPVFIIVLIAVGGGSFYGGMKFNQSQVAANRQNNFQRFVQGGQGQGGAARRNGQGQGFDGGAGFVTGEVISKDDKSLTLKLRDGGSKIVFFSTSTQITKSADGSADDLKVGENVVAGGAANSDGSITAQTIQLR